MTKIYKDPRAVELCDFIRQLYSNNKLDGWIARPHHTNKEIRVGHPEYHTDDNVKLQVDALVESLKILGLADQIGYTIFVCTD